MGGDSPLGDNDGNLSCPRSAANGRGPVRGIDLDLELYFLLVPVLVPLLQCPHL